MARPIFVWRLDELKPKGTLRTAEDGRELKVDDPAYRVWLNFGVVEVEERQDNGSWRLAEQYRAKQ